MPVFNTEPMAKIRAVFLAEDKAKVIAKLHGLGLLDFRKSQLSLIDDSPQAQHQQIYSELVRFEGALAIAPKPKQKRMRSRKMAHMPLYKLLRFAEHNKAVRSIYALSEARKSLQEERQGLAYASGVANWLLCAGVNPSALKSKSAKFAAYVGDAKRIGEMAEALNGEQGVAARYCKNGNSGFVLIAMEPGKETQVEHSFKAAKTKLEQIDLTAKYLDLAKDAKQLQKALEKRIAENEIALERTERELAKLSEAEYGIIAAVVEMLHIELDRANASAMFKKTDRTSLLEGWVPRKKLDVLASALASVTKGKVHVEEMHDKELAPTMLNRPKLLKPFDFGMEFFSLPRSDEIDPTWVFIGSFLLFYGFMVSDVGYGILSLLLATWITKITNPEGLTYNAAKVWQLGAIPAIIFGVLTNQYFGLRLDQYFMPFLGFDWLKNITVFLLISIIFGIVEIIIGLAFGFINKRRHGETKKAYSKLAGIGTIVLGALFVEGAIFGAFGAGMSALFGIGALACLVATIVLGGSEGSEAVSLITHTLSYTRIIGFGLTSVMIAYLIDMAFTPTLAHGVFVFAALVLVFLILHTLNMIVSIFEGIVQGVRLNIVEFFTKFYTGGGVKFKPFSYKRLLTKE
ncbi:MAG: V-type ATP synthase subunit I [Candidatus Micrarchaeia archaeon]